MVQRRRWLARAALLVGAGLLALVLVAATAVASPAAGQEGRNVRRRALDRHRLHRSPARLSVEWLEIQYAVDCKLFNHPHKPGDPGSQLTPEAAVGSPIVSKDGKTYTFKVRPGLKFLTGENVTAASFANAINRVASQGQRWMGLPCIDIIQGSARAKKWTVGEPAPSRQGNTLTIKLSAAGTRPDRAARDAVLPGHQPGGARGEHRLAGRQPRRQLRAGTSVLESQPEQSHHAEAEHVLQGQSPPLRVRPDRVSDRQLAPGD